MPIEIMAAARSCCLLKFFDKVVYNYGGEVEERGHSEQTFQTLIVLQFKKAVLERKTAT